MTMGEYRCSQCGNTYTFIEYRELEKVPIDPDESNPMKGQGYETVCECGSRFHTDKWSLRESVVTPDGEITVSTVALTLAHGENNDQWYETCIFHDYGSRVTDRYQTQDEAEHGHDKRVSLLVSGNYSFKPTGRQIVVDEDE